MWDVHVWVTTSWNSDCSGIRIYPSGSDWYIRFYYDKSSVWYIAWWYNSDLWADCIIFNWTYKSFNGTTWFNKAIVFSRLRIPVWNDLYD